MLKTQTGTIKKDNTVIWRYMTKDKFQWLIENSALYFPNIKQLKDSTNDPNDSLPSAETLTLLKMFKWPPNHLELFLREQLQYGISCWSARKYESEHLWSKFNSCEGVAIKSTVGKLNKSLDSIESLAKAIKYLPVSQDKQQSYAPEDFLFIKDPYYSDEKEYRVLIKNENQNSITIDLNLLIDEIVVGTEEDFNSILDIAATCNMQDKVKHSCVYVDRSHNIHNTKSYWHTSEGLSEIENLKIVIDNILKQLD
ncbi:hypothetical protein [Paenibacillus sp. WLX2291]|uniref:hypothetical protein n=1 Tax=Paenibacillus sp. WLX2291 TaxID=3296934 RepID=UPI003983F480